MERLPSDLVTFILGFLPVRRRVLVCTLVCKRWRSLVYRTVTVLRPRTLAELRNPLAQLNNIDTLCITLNESEEESTDDPSLPSTVTALSFLHEFQAARFPQRKSWAKLTNLKSLSVTLPQRAPSDEALGLLAQCRSCLTHLNMSFFCTGFSSDWGFPLLRSLEINHELISFHSPELEDSSAFCTNFLRSHASQLDSLKLHTTAWLPILAQVSMSSFVNLTTLALEVSNNFGSIIKSLSVSCPRFSSLSLISEGQLEPALILSAAPYLVSLKFRSHHIASDLLDSLRLCTKLATFSPVLKPNAEHLPFYIAVGASLTSLSLHAFDADAYAPAWAQLSELQDTCINVRHLNLKLTHDILYIAWYLPLTSLRVDVGQRITALLGQIVPQYPHLRSVSVYNFEYLPSEGELTAALLKAEMAGLERLIVSGFEEVHSLFRKCELRRFKSLDVVLEPYRPYETELFESRESSDFYACVAVV